MCGDKVAAPTKHHKTFSDAALEEVNMVGAICGRVKFVHTEIVGSSPLSSTSPAAGFTSFSLLPPSTTASMHSPSALRAEKATQLTLL